METTEKSNHLISDGYHTFGELYEHRHTLYLALCLLIGNLNYGNIWRSKKHSDETKFKGWFVLGINKEKGKQITYHLPVRLWKDCEYAETLDLAPEYDGHTPEDVIKRISKIYKY